MLKLDLRFFNVQNKTEYIKGTIADKQFFY